MTVFDKIYDNRTGIHNYPKIEEKHHHHHHHHDLTWGLNWSAFLTSSTSWPRSFFSTTGKRSVSCDIFSRPHLKPRASLKICRRMSKSNFLWTSQLGNDKFFWGEVDNAPLDLGRLQGRGCGAQILLPAIKPNCLQRRNLREEQMERFTKMSAGGESKNSVLFWLKKCGYLLSSCSEVTEWAYWRRSCVTRNRWFICLPPTVLNSFCGSFSD